MKKILLVLLTFSLLLTLAACGAEFSEEDQKIAEECALQKAEEYCKEEIEGHTYGRFPITSYRTSIEDTTFERGKYIVTVEIVFNVAYETDTKYGEISLPQIWKMVCNVTVNNGYATVNKSDVITD